jgi:hypothetical protein
VPRENRFDVLLDNDTDVCSVVDVSPTLKKRRNLDRLSTDGPAAPLTRRPAASSV